jgi:hypothetical protein
MADHTILLGYEIRTGRAVNIPLRHLAVTGQTQESGKTTTLEALVSRAQKPAIAFVTKRGERSFSSGHRVPPYFRDRADWQFVCSIIDATLQEKNKFLRPWIMRICRATQTLADVQREVRAALAKAQGINESVYTQLDAYLDLIIPEISRIPMTPGIRLVPGLNVMDVSHFATPMQMLFVQSALDWINQNERDTIVIIPEAWEFVPEGKSSPVKASAISLVRKGAGLGNFIWVDSQDMAGVDKTILRGCTVWLIGVQREANEIKRNLANIPAGIQRPKAADIARLDKGQFYACWKDRTIKVHVAPAWMPERDAWSIATGRRKIEEFRPPPPPQPELFSDLPPVVEPLANHRSDVRDNIAPVPATRDEVIAAAPNADEEALYQRFKARLMQESPRLLRVMAERSEIVVERQVLRVKAHSLQGRLAKMIADGFFDEPRNSKAVVDALKRRRVSVTQPSVGAEADKLVKLGFLTKNSDSYKCDPEMKINVVLDGARPG